MSATTKTTIRQFSAIAPKQLKRDGRTFKPKHVLTAGENVVRFGYVARKRRGAFLGDKIDVKVEYQPGPDTYDIEITFCDGVSLENVVVSQVFGAYFDMFADIQMWLDRN